MSKGLQALRILVADDHELMRNSIRDLLRGQEDWKIVCEATTGVETVKEARRLKPTLAIVDIEMPKLDGIEATRQILQSIPETKILTLADRSAQAAQRALEAGAHGYLLKSDLRNELVIAIKTIAQGGLFLARDVSQIVAGQSVNNPKASRRLQAKPTSRQRQVIQLLAEGKVNKEVASILNISVRTAETHRSNIMLKFGFHSLPDLVRFAIREGIVPVQGESPRR
jgi:DNA-binding NarL/FixJ family response regulator